MPSLTEKDHDRTVDIRLGQTVRVTLPENASTGYRWAVERSDEEILETLKPEPHYPAGAVGSGGEVAFAFRGRKAGTGEILLKRWRPWEGDASVTGRFRLRIQVQP